MAWELRENLYLCKLKNADITTERMSQDKENQIIEEPEVNSGQQQASDFGGYEKLITLSPREHIR